MTASDSPKSTGEMMTGILGNLGNLVRHEADLARSEMAGGLSKAGASFEVMAVALVLAVTALNLLAASAVAGLVWAGVPAHWATLGVGLGLLVLSLIVFRAARAALHQIGLVPTRAAQNLQRDAAAIRDSFNDT